MIIESIEKLIEESENLNNYLYHYSGKKFDEIQTLNKQGKSEEFKVDMSDYNNHISVHIDPLPIDLILENFPETSNYHQGDKLYEYIIDINTLNINKWLLVETPFDVISDSDKLNFIPDNIFFPLFKFIKSNIKETGENLDGLNSAVRKYKNKIKNYFIKWINSKHFNETNSKYYSLGVPHVFLYPIDGVIKPMSVKRIK